MVKTLELSLDDMTTAIVHGLIHTNKLAVNSNMNINIEFSAEKDKSTGELALSGCTLKIED